MLPKNCLYEFSSVLSLSHSGNTASSFHRVSHKHPSFFWPWGHMDNFTICMCKGSSNRQRHEVRMPSGLSLPECLLSGSEKAYVILLTASFCLQTVLQPESDEIAINSIGCHLERMHTDTHTSTHLTRLSPKALYTFFPLEVPESLYWFRKSDWQKSQTRRVGPDYKFHSTRIQFCD